MYEARRVLAPVRLSRMPTGGSKAGARGTNVCPSRANPRSGQAHGFIVSAAEYPREARPLLNWRKAPVDWRNGCPAGSLLCRLHALAPARHHRRHSGTVPPGVQKSLLCSPSLHQLSIWGLKPFFKGKSPAGPPEAQADDLIPQAKPRTARHPTSGAR